MKTELPTPTVEQCLTQLRKMFPDRQIIIGIRVLEHSKRRGYFVQIGINGEDFDCDTLAECMTQIRKWKTTQCA